MLKELCRHLLELGGFGAENPVEIVWPEILPQDMQAERAALQVDMGLGVVSKSTVAQKLGYDWDTEQARMEAETVTSGEEASELPTADEAARLKVVFEAVDAAVTAGIPLETVLAKYLDWSESEVNDIVSAQEDSQPDPLEMQARMEALQNANAVNQQPGQAAPPQAVGPGADSGRVNPGGGRRG